MGQNVGPVISTSLKMRQDQHTCMCPPAPHGTHRNCSHRSLCPTSVVKQRHPFHRPLHNTLEDIFRVQDY